VLRTAMALADKSGPKPVAAEPPRRSPKEQLERAERRANQLRTRRRAGVIALVAVLVGAAVTAAIALTSPSSSKRVAATGRTTTTESTLPVFDSTTVPPETVPTTTPVTAAPATTTPVAAPATTSSLPCRNSSDPRCGTFRWDPPPGANAPLNVSISYTPQNPQSGQEVIFTVHVVDPDASPIIAGEQTCNPPGYGDVGTSRCTPSCAQPGYGPWTPPARQQGTGTFTYKHTYSNTATQDQTFTAHFWFASFATPCPKNPYASAADSTIQVTVSPQPSSP
jgi:hypothetical protein